MPALNFSTLRNQKNKLADELDVSKHFFLGHMILLALLLCEGAILLVKSCSCVWPVLKLVLTLVQQQATETLQNKWYIRKFYLHRTRWMVLEIYLCLLAYISVPEGRIQMKHVFKLGPIYHIKISWKWDRGTYTTDWYQWKDKTIFINRRRGLIQWQFWRLNRFWCYQYKKCVMKIKNLSDFLL